jgi:hypothetical protein
MSVQHTSIRRYSILWKVVFITPRGNELTFVKI